MDYEKGVGREDRGVFEQLLENVIHDTKGNWSIISCQTINYGPK